MLNCYCAKKGIIILILNIDALSTYILLFAFIGLEKIILALKHNVEHSLFDVEFNHYINKFNSFIRTLKYLQLQSAIS